MQTKTFGNPESPLLICIPGLLGGIEDFQYMIPKWQTRYFVAILDPNAEQRERSGLNIPEEVMKSITYSSTSDQVMQIIKKQNANKAYLAGISLGGKVVYDFASKYPEKLAGALITDVGTGPFEDSELHNFVYKTVTEAPLHLPWPDMREYLKRTITDRSLRSLIQTQISYPNQKPPGIWKTAMKNFGEMLERQEIGNQFSQLSNVDQILFENRCRIKVLQAEKISGIGIASLPHMKRLKSLQLIPISGASHFIHVTHKDSILNEMFELLPNT
jgi:pimeloyl-ACP methyl ester carboxylesterase